jgi:hypothetical protein
MSHAEEASSIAAQLLPAGHEDDPSGFHIVNNPRIDRNAWQVPAFDQLAVGEMTNGADTAARHYAQGPGRG